MSLRRRDCVEKSANCGIAVPFLAPGGPSTRLVIFCIASSFFCDETEVHRFSGKAQSFERIVSKHLNRKPIHMKSIPLGSRPSHRVIILALLILGSHPAAQAAYKDVVLANNPVAYYRLEETSGTTAIDGTANHFDTAYATDADTNGVTIWPIMGLPGINTNSLLFRYYVDSSDVPHHGFVNITYHPELSPVTGDGQHGAPFSAECWVL